MVDALATNTEQHELSQFGETTRVSWSPPANMDYEMWASIGGTMQEIGRSLNWWTGDWLNAGEQRYGEMYTQAIEITGSKLESLMKYKAVSARIPAEERRINLTWSHHFAVAWLEDEHRGPMLEIADHFELTSRDLKSLCRLSFDEREELIDGARLCETTEQFLSLWNSIKLSKISDKSTVNGDSHEDEDEDDTLDTDEPEDNEPEDLDADMVFQFWEDHGVPVKVCNAAQVVWQGIAVRIGKDNLGRPTLVWEEV